ncbi:MAG: PocR ligand-binding domain-containing protein [Candidatus Omnitrophica bacterium]|nr:PocR ligand-binding domain-containing protein [Candidatus Omnitrophota bacterium]MDE2222720.1 PocR ligand-binding domain-containing protein [Candidatus Omnitrophota bacterium]
MDLNEIIQFEKLKPIVYSFIDVLKINIFIVDAKGKVLLTPKSDLYGWRLVSYYGQGTEGNGHKIESNILDKFTASPEGYLEYKDFFGLSSFAMAVHSEAQKPLAYIIVGPVILNKKLRREEYEEMVGGRGAWSQDFLDEIDQVRVLSQAGLHSILELLQELSKYMVQANNEHKKPQGQFGRGAFLSEIRSKVLGLRPSVHMDEIFVAILDMAMVMTQAESGSIMTVDERTDEFLVKVSRGLDDRWVERTFMKKGEGLAGFAMKEKKTLVIDSEHPNNRIKHLLKRPEIKYSIVMPLVTGSQSVLGVLNLSFRNGPGSPEGHSEEFIQNLFKLTSAAIEGASMGKNK